MNRIDLIGRWNILAWTQEYDDGRVLHPMGQELDGFIEYGPHGMFCFLSRRDRQSFATGGQWSANDSEKAAAYSSCLTYAGDFDVEGDVVVHRVGLSLFPNWVGGTQRRQAKLEGDVLALTARIEEGTSEARTAKLAFRRAIPQASASA